MATLHCGIDFGTTNSSAALAADGQVRVLELDPLNDNPRSLPSLIYLSRDGERLIGRQAATTFIERNVDREVALQQVDLGIDIEGYVASEGDKEDGYRPRDPMSDVREAVRARATVEVNAPGRLFQSVKTSLRHVSFKNTEVFGVRYQLEELVAMVLEPIKAAIDEAAGEDVDTVVMGRPVRFSEHEQENAVAERRLEVAAGLAGFKNVVFFFEPVAACVEYAANAEADQKLMVVDIGGGTCDVCIMHFGSAQGAGARLAESEILSVSGVPVAGDAIDREMIRAKIFPLLGSRARYGPSKLPMPQYLFSAIADWQTLYKLNTEETINWLTASAASSTQPEALRALRHLIQRNLGYPLTREAEAAKRRLSGIDETRIEFIRPPIHIDERIERQEFAHIIEYELEKMRDCLSEAEQMAGVKPEELDMVLTTGGTSLVPAIRHMLEARYSPERLHARDTFTSVATGLATVSQFM